MRNAEYQRQLSEKTPSECMPVPHTTKAPGVADSTYAPPSETNDNKSAQY
jgi:hypothetical protein